MKKLVFISLIKVVTSTIFVKKYNANLYHKDNSKNKEWKCPVCGGSQLYQQYYNWSQPVLFKLGGTNTPHAVIGCLHTWIDAFCILKCKINLGLITKLAYLKRKKYLAHILPNCFSVKYQVLPKHLKQKVTRVRNKQWVSMQAKQKYPLKCFTACWVSKLLILKLSKQQ